MKNMLLLIALLSAPPVCAADFSRLLVPAAQETELDRLRVAAVRYCNDDAGWLKFAKDWDERIKNSAAEPDAIVRQWCVARHSWFTSAPGDLKASQVLELARMVRYVTVREIYFSLNWRPHAAKLKIWREFLEAK